VVIVGAKEIADNAHAHSETNVDDLMFGRTDRGWFGVNELGRRQMEK
jgi:hypothetical protein